MYLPILGSICSLNRRLYSLCVLALHLASMSWRKASKASDNNGIAFSRFLIAIGSIPCRIWPRRTSASVLARSGVKAPHHSPIVKKRCRPLMLYFKIKYLPFVLCRQPNPFNSVSHIVSFGCKFLTLFRVIFLEGMTNPICFGYIMATAMKIKQEYQWLQEVY